MHTATSTDWSVVVSLFRVPNDEESSPPNRFSDDPVLSVVIDGKKFQIPRYQPKEVRLTDNRYKLEQAVLWSIKEKMTKLANEIILNEKCSLLLLSSASEVLSEMKDIHAFNCHLMRTDTPYPLSSGFGYTNCQMLFRMIEKTSGEKLETLTKEEAYKRFEVVLEAVEKLTAMSNTGLNLDWTKLKIDGVGVEQYLKPSVLRLVSRRLFMYQVLMRAAHHMGHTRFAGGRVRR